MARAVDYGRWLRPVDYGRWLRPVDYGLRPVDYAPSVLWITGLTALWITMLRICGLVD